MIEYLVTQNLPLGGVQTFYLFYIWILLVMGVRAYFYVEGIRTDIKYEKKEEARLQRARLEVKYTAFIFEVKRINKFYRYWRVV